MIEWPRWSRVVQSRARQSWLELELASQPKPRRMLCLAGLGQELSSGLSPKRAKWTDLITIDSP